MARDSFIPDSFRPDEPPPEERPPGPGVSAGEGAIKPTFWQALGGSARERLGEIGQAPQEIASAIGRDVTRTGQTLGDRNLPLRLAPMTVPGAGPVLSSAMNLGTEGLAQYREGEFRPLPLALAALPAFLAGGARAARAGDRMLTRMSPSRFAAKHTEALGAAQNLATELTPDTQALYRQAGEAARTAPPLELTDTGRALSELRRQQLTAPALSGQSAAERELVGKLEPLSQPTMPLTQVDDWMRELTKVITNREPAKGAAKLVQGSAVKDLERAAAAGNTGADLMRQAAEGYKSGMGARRLTAQVAKASPPLTGAEPALNIRALGKSLRTDTELPRLLGPEGMAKVADFLDQYRGLPPERMSTLATILKTMGGGSGGGLVGSAIGGPVGAGIGSVLGALGPEYLQNLMFVGRNPAAVNRAATLGGQAGRVAIPTLLEALRRPPRDAAR